MDNRRYLRITVDSEGPKDLRGYPLIFVDNQGYPYTLNMEREQRNEIHNDTKNEYYKEYTPIQNFYDGANLFITGGTGFLGKLLIEKLLRSCPTLSTIYILVRNKKGKNVSSRIEELLENPLFERLKQECPKYSHKIVGVAGDCSLPDLGLSIQDRRILTDEISIVFHVAATVRFDEKIRTATAINIRSPQEMLKLSREMKQLKAFVHVSTAYANCTESVIAEKIYPPAIDSKQMMVLAENVSEKLLEKITPILLDKYPNTYTLTKQIAEDIVRKESQNLPVAIFRPSIVISTYKEPVRGWVDNMYGPTGVIAGAGVGLLRTLQVDPEVNANMVPGDMCVNSMIACAWDVAETFEKCKIDNENFTPKVYNYESSHDNPINWKTYMSLAETNGLATPTVKAIWYYSFRVYKTRILYMLSTLLLHYFPALLIDSSLFCLGKKPRMFNVYKKIHKFSAVISFFALRNFTFDSHNVQDMLLKITKEDKDIFLMDLAQLDWAEYFKDYALGLRVYLVKDPLSTMPEALVKWRRLYIAHQLLKAVVTFIILRLLWMVLSMSFNWYRDNFKIHLNISN